jgi:hypothetical protein
MAFVQIPRKSQQSKIYKLPKIIVIYVILSVSSTQKEKILVPASQVKQLIHWYHHMLVHPGADRLFNTLAQHFYWRKTRDDIKSFVRVCKECQKGKRGLRGYGKIPLKDIETQPWKDVCIDLSGPWQAKVNHNKISFHALACIDPFTSWIEIIPIYTKESPFIREPFLQNGSEDTQDHPELFLIKEQNLTMLGCMHCVLDGISNQNQSQSKILEPMQ